MNKTSNSKIKAAIGLGNPAEEYLQTYHNIGRLLVEYLANGKEFDSVSKKNFEFFKLSNISVNQSPNQCESVNDLILIKPLLFMNESGRAVQEATKFFNLKSEEMVIVHDDSDMVTGNYKISFDQSSGGHKGIQSIIDALGTQKFWRIKIGIRPQNEKTRKKAEDFVLKKISKPDSQKIKDVFEKITEKIKEL